MARITWRDRSVYGIETRRGLFVLAQMSVSPFLIFFDAFRERDAWDDIDLEETPILFCRAVTKQFLKNSRMTRHKAVEPRAVDGLPTRWIFPRPASRKVTLWPGTDRERSVISPFSGGMLVEKDVYNHTGGPYKHPSGVYDAVVMPEIDPADHATIDAHETTSLGVFPGLNERLYQCHRAGRNVSPEKAFLFGHEMPDDFDVWLDISYGGPERAEPCLALFR